MGHDDFNWEDHDCFDIIYGARKFRGKCLECNWLGPPRDTKDEAEKDIADHVGAGS